MQPALRREYGAGVPGEMGRMRIPMGDIVAQYHRLGDPSQPFVDSDAGARTFSPVRRDDVEHGGFVEML
jgi:hypothetical protein